MVRVRFALTGSLVLAWGVASCVSTADEPIETGPATDDQLQAERLAHDTVWLGSAAGPRVVTYVSMARREVYVDHNYRDRASWLLNAHISVSTWHWRIPLPGDDPGVPITPGDHVREFEELDISLWDRSAPTMDDIRIVLADAVGVEWAPECIEIPGSADDARGTPESKTWLSARLSTTAAQPSPSMTIREDFRMLGNGTLYRDAACGGEGQSVPVAGWSRRPER